MKKIKKKLKKLNNQGSSIVMVIAALGFMGIIVGALLMAAGYTYRQKLQDLNARDNFYYVEQAMNEIYAGVGSKTTVDMQNAYIYTIENMVYFDLDTGTYKSISDEAANRKFKDAFMLNLEKNPDFMDEAKLAESLKSYITNSSVTLDDKKLYIDKVYHDKDGKVIPDDKEKDSTDKKLKSIIIKNITLTRTEEYNRSQANGSYTQTISTDIEISEPDFIVAFNSSNSDKLNFLEYAIVADMGLEVNQTSKPLIIAGNVYAGSDYYNKKYNVSTYNSSVDDKDRTFFDLSIKDSDGNPITYNHGSVTSKHYDTDESKNTYYNKYSTGAAAEKDFYDGVESRSANSGIYINGSTVSILADTVIVPGTIAVMNSADLSIYGKDGTYVSEAEVWTDNLVLDGTSDKITTIDDEGQEKIDYKGAEAVIRADLFVKDDTEINATGSKLELIGSYYGFGDSTSKDTREFVPTVTAKNFQIKGKDAEGNDVVENRGHYNSSAIIVNGEHSTLDLGYTDVIYLAGRSYIELSKKVTQVESAKIKGTDGTRQVISQTYTYTPESADNLYTDAKNDAVDLRDYKTGESISLKSNQQAYIPVMFTGTPEFNDTEKSYMAKLHTGLEDTELFDKYFPKTTFGKDDDVYIPCVMQLVSGKKYYYYDFETAYDMLVEDKPEIVKTYASAQYYAAGFIEDYVNALNDKNCGYSKYLTDIRNYENFEAGEIKLPEKNPTLEPEYNPVIYSSGAITSKVDTSFNMITPNSPDDISSLLRRQNISGVNLGTDSDLQGAKTAINFSNDLEFEYEIMKWNLGHYDLSKTEEQLEEKYIEELIKHSDFGTASITPINKYFNFRSRSAKVKEKDAEGNEIETDKEVSKGIQYDVRPAKPGENGSTGVLKLESGYCVWVSNDDVHVTDAYATDPSGSGYKTVRGIVISKGDVYFEFGEETYFEGLIVAGGKVYINSNLSRVTASPEICRAIIRECQLSSDLDCKYLLSLFRGYENSTVETVDQSDTSRKTIDNIEYSDVVSFVNWMKNVE